MSAWAVEGIGENSFVRKPSHSDIAKAIRRTQKGVRRLRDGNDLRGFDDRCLGLVGDQFAQKRTNLAVEVRDYS
jgi:hypothetical protein